jgi:hypothetical protein
VLFTNGKQEWKTTAGTLGISIALDNIGDVTDPCYCDYSEYSKIESGHKASATLQTEDGSRFKVIDYVRLTVYSVSGTNTLRLRQFKILGYITAMRTKLFRKTLYLNHN